MKIGILHFSALPVLGGVERVMSEQSTVFRASGHSVTLFCCEGGRPEDYDRRVRVTRHASRQELISLLEPEFAALDAVLLHNVGTMPFYPEWTAALRILPKALPGVHWICWVHDLSKGNPDYPPLRDASDQALFESPCAEWRYVAVSEKRAREVEQQLGVPCTVIPNGFSPGLTLGLDARLAEKAEALGWWDADAVLFLPCRLVRRKSIETGIQIVGALRELGKEAHFLITGAADPHNASATLYQNELLELRRSLALEREIHFLATGSSIAADELEQVYRLADALLMPSRQEGFGLPLLEAGAMRLPAFCPDLEPMNTLPGVSLWNPEWPPAEIAAWLIRQIESRDAIQARKSVMRNYRWQAVYRNFLAPLLQHPHSRKQ